MEQILEEARKFAKEAEAYIVTSESTPIQFETNRLKHAQTHQSTSLALRVIKDGRIGYATSTGLEDMPGLTRAVEAATRVVGRMARMEIKLTKKPRDRMRPHTIMIRRKSFIDPP